MMNDRTLAKPPWTPCCHRESCAVPKRGYETTHTAKEKGDRQPASPNPEKENGVSDIRSPATSPTSHSRPIQATHFFFFFFSLAIKTEAPYHIRPVFPHLNKFRNPWTTTSRCRTPTLASLSESFCERDGAFPGPVWGCCGDDDDCDGKHRSLLSDPRSRAAASVSSPPSPSSSEEAAAAAADVSPSTTDCCRLNRQGVLVPGDSHSMPGDDGLLEDGGCSLPSALASSREALPWKRRRTTVPK